MAVGIGLSLDTSFLNSLDVADQKIKELTDKTNALSRATIKAFQQMANQGVTPFVEQLRKQKMALEEVGKIKGTHPALAQMQADAKAAVDELNNLIKTLEKTKAYKGEQSGKTAISFANSVLGQRGQAKSINNMRLALRQLEEAQNRVNLNTKTGQKNYEKIGETIRKVKEELDKVTNSNKQLNKEAEKTNKSMSSMGKSISMAFAVNAVREFGNQLIRIRGEFEMQHRSLQVLLQDVDKANELWDKTVALAIKSPFRVKQLVTYTKNLAAYRVEADKLYDTTKMLADVSAGLGVDMNRLILAFGQVKAANFLRGTELRQFSEAGVNMLEELSKRFTKLEGRAVSVGDVFERVSKRMVSFKDVEAVFQTITSEGGVFFQMQEKQAETLRGMIMNLKDSLDLMFNEIGSSNEDSLKGAVRIVKELVDNWRKLAPVINAAGAALLAGFSVKIIASIGAAFTTLWGIIAANPIGAAITLISALVVGIVSARKSVDELTASLNEVDKNISKQLEESISLYRKLSEEVRDVTATEKEREEAMGRLKDKFDEILPDQFLELKYIQGISDNYDEATAAMMNYYNAKAVEQKKDRVESKFGEDVDTEISDLIRGTRKMIGSWSEKGLISEREEIALLAGVGGVINQVSEGIKKGDIDNSFDSVRRAILQKLSEYSGVGSTWDKYISGGGSLFFEKNINEIIKKLGDYKSAMEAIQGLPTRTYAEQEAANIFLPQKENIEAVKSAFKEITNLVSEYSNIAVGEWTELDARFNKIVSGLPEAASAYLPLLYEMLEEMKVKAAGVEEGSFEFGKSLQGLQQTFTRGIADVMWQQLGEQMFDPMNDKIHEELVLLVANMDNTLRDEANKLNLTPFQESVVKAMEVIANVTQVSVNEFSKFIPKIGDGISTTRQAVEGEIALLESDIKRWENSLKVEPPELISLRPDTHDLTQEKVDLYTKLVEAFKMLRNYLGGEDKKKKKKDDTLDERIKVVDQMNAKYKELNKTLSKGESLKGAFEAYKDAFATAYKREDVRSMTPEQFATNVLNFPNEDAIIAWLKNLATTVTDIEDKFKVQMAQGKFEMDVKVRVKKEADAQLKKDIQGLFDRYDLSLDLKKLNIPPELGKSLFNVDYLDLEDLKRAVQRQEFLFIGKEMRDEYKQFLDKIEDMENKASVERMKTYSKYLIEGMDERIRLKLEELRKLKEIEESKEFTTDEKKKIKEQVSKEYRQEQNKQEWKEFQGSDMYTMIFEDLEHYGSEAIGILHDKLVDLKKSLSDLPATEVKEIISQIEKLENLEIKRNPFENWKKYAGEVKKIDFSEEELSSQLLNAQQAEEDAQRIIDTYNNVVNATNMGAFQELDEETIMQWGEIQTLAEDTGRSIEDIVKDQKEIVTQSQKEQANITKNLNSYKKLSKSQKEALNTTQEYLTQVGKLFSSSKELMEALGVESDSVAMTIADTGSSMVSLTLSAVQFTLQLQAMGVAANSALGIIGYVAIAIQAVASIISAILSAKDKALQEQIDGHIERADKLHKQYEEISEALDTAYDASRVRAFNKELERTLELEIKSIEAAIALEKDQKESKVDNDWIDEQERRIKELYDVINEEHDKYIERWGGFGSEENRFDFIESMTEAWLEAFKETGDGLSALEDKWDEYFDNLVLKQMSLRISKQKIDEYLAIWDKYVSKGSEGGEDITTAEANKLATLKETLLSNLNEEYRALAQYLGVGENAASGGGLTALQKGIQGITEDTAQVIESYLNSLRSYVASISSDTSSLLNETKALHRLLDSMTASHQLGGVGLKVIL